MIDTDALHGDGVADSGNDPSGSNGRDFTAFYHAQFPGQLRRAAILARSADEAADAVQQAFVDVYRRWSELAEPERYLTTGATPAITSTTVPTAIWTAGSIAS